MHERVHMKKILAKLSTLQKMLILASLVGLVLVLGSLFTIFIGFPGWCIGVAIGSIIEVICILCLFVGSNTALKKGSAPIFLLFYFFRMTLFVAGFLLAAVMDYYLKIPEFKYSIFGVLIGYSPMQIIVAIVMLKEKKNIMNIGELS